MSAHVSGICISLHTFGYCGVKRKVSFHAFIASDDLRFGDDRHKDEIIITIIIISKGYDARIAIATIVKSKSRPILESLSNKAVQDSRI